VLCTGIYCLADIIQTLSFPVTTTHLSNIYIKTRRNIFLQKY